MLGWWLNAGTRVAITLPVICVTTAIATRTLAEAVAFWGGLVIAWGVVLFVIGPGNIWPIVFAFICGLTAMSVVAGYGLRWVIEQGLTLTKIKKGSPKAPLEGR
jgi:hypothetical protein